MSSGQNLQHMRVVSMSLPENNELSKDNGGCRSGIERRQFIYTECIPERRSGKDRRKGFDRRSTLGRRRGYERRGNQNSGYRNAVEHGD